MPGLIGRTRRQVNRLLRHSYTRIPHIDVLDTLPTPIGTGYDEYGAPIMVAGQPVPAQACLYDDNESVLLRTEHGTQLVSLPHLYVRHDDPLSADDVVQNVSDAGGRVLVVSAVAEGDAVASSPSGVAFRVLRLREVVLP